VSDNLVLDEDSDDFLGQSSTSPSDLMTHYSNEDQLRSALKTLRTNSKRNEQSLVATLTSLRKTVEKAAKEDQRARSRIVALEEAIRKAGIVEVEVRGKEKREVEERLREATDEEEKVRGVLGEWQEGGKPTLVEERRHSATGEDEGQRAADTQQQQTGATSNLAELAKELDALNKAIEAVEKEKADKAGEVLKSLEREMMVVEGELIQ
jgi:hypothetical protein